MKSFQHRWTALRLLVVLLCLLSGASGCVAEEFSLDDCGQTCGDGPLFLVDRLEFVIDDSDGLDGFDIDGQSEDCGSMDGTSPDGVSGIDNQFGAVWDVLPDAVTLTLPNAINTSLRDGSMMVVGELVGPPDFSVDGPAAIVFREGDGDVLIGANGRPLGGQTIDLRAEDNLLGLSDQAEIRDGILEGHDLEMTLRLTYLGTRLELPFVRGRVLASADGEGGVDMKLGGVVPLDAVMDIVLGLGGCGDAMLGETLEALVPLLVDIRTRSDGECDGISGALRAHAVPVYVFAP